MIALFLPARRPAALDRARALVSALGPSTTIVSPQPAPPVPPARWIQLTENDPAGWREWVRTHRPTLVVIDGSGTHTRAAMGVGATVALVVQMEGDVDGDLGAAYSEADLILAPWPAGQVVERWPARWDERTLHLGAFGGQAAWSAGRRPASVADGGRGPQCVVLTGTGAGPSPRERRATMSGIADWTWTYAPEHTVLDDGPVWDALWQCSVVVCAPTLANLAAVAVARKPAVLVTTSRSMGQAFLAEAARRTAPALVLESWPSPEEWRPLLARARLLDGGAWDAWSPEPGLSALARVAGGEQIAAALRTAAQV